MEVEAPETGEQVGPVLVDIMVGDREGGGDGGGTIRQNMAQKYVTDMLSEYLVNIFI